MVSIDTHALHAISWVDLATPNVDDAASFYAGLFGWTTFNDGETPYTIFQSQDQPVAGAMALPETGDIAPVWTIYVNVADADATCAAASKAGGTVMQPAFDIPGGGRIAVIADPSGAAIGLFEGMADNGSKVMGEIGAPAWFDCMTREVRKVRPFYEAIFGWTAKETPFDLLPYTTFFNDGVEVCGTMHQPPILSHGDPNQWVTSFVVADTDQAAEYVKGNGGKVQIRPFDTPYGRSCSVGDPWGATLTLLDARGAKRGPLVGGSS
ncbi:MAG: VOC family protein [Actinomycetota bacterium]